MKLKRGLSTSMPVPYPAASGVTTMEKSYIKMRGYRIEDHITYLSTGETETREYTDNKMVKSVLTLIMMALRGDEVARISYWAIGTGSSAWDSAPVNPSVDETHLTKEIGRKYIEPEDMVYLDPETFEESSTPTSCVQVTVTFNENECNGLWREFGLFGGDATEEKDSGIMIDKKHHEFIHKTDDMVIERVIRFNIAFA